MNNIVKELIAEMRESVQNHLRAGETEFANELDDYIEGLKAAQPESVEGDWYISADTGTMCVDLSPEPQRQISLLGKRDGSVGYAIYAHGQSFNGEDANSEDFFTAIAALSRPTESAAPGAVDDAMFSRALLGWIAHQQNCRVTTVEGSLRKALEAALAHKTDAVGEQT